MIGKNGRRRRAHQHKSPKWRGGLGTRCRAGQQGSTLGFYSKCDGKEPEGLSLRRDGQDLMGPSGGSEKTVASVKIWPQGDPLGGFLGLLGLVDRSRVSSEARRQLGLSPRSPPDIPRFWGLAPKDSLLTQTRQAHGQCPSSSRGLAWPGLPIPSPSPANWPDERSGRARALDWE